MLFNVWALIYPNRMKALGRVEGVSDADKAKARRTAFLFSRTNTMLSLPLLFFMAFGFSHRAVVRALAAALSRVGEDARELDHDERQVVGHLTLHVTS